MTSSPAESGPELDKVFTPPSHEQWLESALAGLAEGSTLESLQHQTLDGLSIRVLYDSSPATHELATAIASASAHTPASESAGTGRSTSWDNRVTVDARDDVTAANKALNRALAGGNTSVEARVDAATDLAALLQGVVLDLAPVSLRAGQDVNAVSDQFVALLASQNIDTSTLRCSLNADPLSDCLRSGHMPDSFDDQLGRLGEFSVDMRTSLPRARTVLVDGTIHHNAGASAVQELQASIASGTLYLNKLLSAGMSLADASDAMVFQVACDADALMGIVKLRTLRVLWQHVLSQFNDETGPMQIVAETSQRYLSTMDPWNNHLRNIVACSAAAMGGANTIIVHPHDRIGDWQSAEDPAIGERMARNLPIILERESGLLNVADPMAGSHAIESLTDKLIRMTWQALASMGDTDDWMQLLQSGQWQADLADMQKKRNLLLTEQKQIVVGVNRFVASAKPDAAPATDQASSGVAASSDQANFALRLVRDAQPFESAAMAGDKA